MAKYKYVCPRCGLSVTLPIKPKETPNCGNYEAHKTRTYTAMKEVVPE